jgi:hypothetical protein
MARNVKGFVERNIYTERESGLIDVHQLMIKRRTNE